MKIAIDTSSLSSQSQFRGIGFYTSRLIEQLETMPSIQLIKFVHKLNQAADLIHYPGFNPFCFSFPLVHQLPFIITVHDLVPLKFPLNFPPGIKGKLSWLVQRRLLEFASAIITDSYVSKTDILKYTGLQPGKIQVVYLAADKIFKPLKDQAELIKVRQKYHLPEKFVLYVGDVNYNKNLPLLVQTCLQHNHPLVLVGKQIVAKDFDRMHPENKSLVVVQKLIKSNPGKIFPLGFVKTADLVALYNLATVYAQPSLAEGFGLPVLEAFSCGCPVITSKATSLAEISGSAAVLVNPGSKLAISQALKAFWLDSALQKKYRLLGLLQARQFSWEKTGKETLKVYEKVLSQP